MKHVFRKFFSLAALLSLGALQANDVSPTLVYRSQGFHGDRQRNVGVAANHINLSEQESWYGTLDLTVGYMRSFKNNQIARALFGQAIQCVDDCNDRILVQGSGVADRNANAWLADYLYLHCAYNGSFSLKPLIQNVVVDLDFYLGMDEWVNGMYFRIYGPINWTKWQTEFCPNNPDNVATTSCSAGYFTPSGNEVLLAGLGEYFSGNAPASVDNITFQPLKFAKMPNCDETRTGFADLRMELGWNFLQDADYHLGVGIHAAAPTGNSRHAQYVMQAVVGNGSHWELGGTIHGNYVFWRSEDEEKHFGFYVDAVITHLFKANEQRTFDLKDKNNSRYMLASKFTRTITPVDGLAGLDTAGEDTGAETAALFQFALEYAPVANLTTTEVKVSVGVQADVTAMFNFTSRGFSWDLGYNFYGRGCEDISCPSECNPCNTDSLFLPANVNKWALKGDARMFGYNVNDPVALSASQSKATMLTGINAITETTTPALANIRLQNGGIDNSKFAVTNDGTNRLIHTPVAQGGANVNAQQIKTSIQPLFLSQSSVQLQETRGLSNTVFTHLSYTWERDNWTPYLGIGGSAEFGKNEGKCNDACATNSCDSCVYTSLSQWSIWLKGGLSFN